MEATTRVTADEFRQNFEALSDKASRGPVVITRNGSDFLAVISATKWNRLRRCDRRAGLTEELGEAWINALRA